MKTIKLFTIASALIFSVNNTNAGNDDDKAFEKGNMIVSAGYGFPNLVGTVFNSYKSYTGYSVSSLGPIFGKFEYAVANHIGLGINIGYSQTTVKYDLTDYYDTYQAKWTYSSLSILARFNFHFGNSKKFDPYVGAGIGYRTTSSVYQDNDPYTLDDTYTLKNLIPFGFEMTFGTRFYFTKNIGIYAEVGFAKAPLQGGLAIKF